MAYPVIGQNIQLEVSDGYYTGRYSARVQDMEKASFHIELPMRSESKVPTSLPDGTAVHIRYRAVDGALCSFATTVIGRLDKPIKMLILKRPGYSQIHRQQRREFLRVPLAATLDLVYMDSQSKQIITTKALGSDISGGGISFCIKQGLPLQANDIIGFSFSLPIEGKGYGITGKARVIRIAPPNEAGNKMVSLKFFELSEPDRQRIIQYSFKRQIELREKGVLE
ncbi:MAG: flagellar brake domain-containing protein [Tumebacillaceae bacterium]